MAASSRPEGDRAGGDAGGAVKRPVQLTWSRIEESVQDGFRAGRAGADDRAARRGRNHPRLAGADRGARHRERSWRARLGGGGGDGPAIGAVGGRRAALRHPGGRGRPSAGRDRHPGPAAGAPARTATPPSSPRASSTSWPRLSGIEPLSFRMQMLGDNPRLARCLTTAATLGGWDGGAGQRRWGSPATAPSARISPPGRGRGDRDQRRACFARSARSIAGGSSIPRSSAADRGRPDLRNRRRDRQGRSASSAAARRARLRRFRLPILAPRPRSRSSCSRATRSRAE
jgi:hypothetical protein